ncbi:MAG: C69 family dipeptidase [Candidatus Aminicenantes bacterium]|nr:C69 family dipeptidase [Candidatus Aminicenantes bacterium]
MNSTKNIRRAGRLLSVLALLVFAGIFSLGAGQNAAVSASAATNPWPVEFDGCTSIQVGRLASTDGSVMTAHTCDGNYRQWVNIVPHAKHSEGSKNKIYSGKMHTEMPADQRGIVVRGEIPQVAETYAFFNTAYPAMNEAGLAIGETTIGGRRELYNPEGMFMIEEIERIVLERCSTAREAIKLAGQLIKEYGYGDFGECITIADSKEVWHFEVFGEGPLQVGGVWAAVRIPDDHVGISANIPRISDLDLKNPDRYMASENVFSVAEDLGFYDPKKGEPFKFWKAYSGGRPYSIRDFYVLNTVAPSLKLNMQMEELPFSVKAEKKLSVSDVLALYRETYAGTEYDAGKNLMVPRRQPMRRPGTQPPAQGQGQAAPQPEMVRSPLAQPWMSGDLVQLVNALKPGTIHSTRSIAISGCAYATVLQCRPNMPPAIGTVCWFAFDNPGLSPRIPIYAGATSVPPAFEICGQHRYRTDSAAWMFRRTNRLATLKWAAAEKIMMDNLLAFEKKALLEMPLVEKVYMNMVSSKTPGTLPFTPAEYLTKWCGDFAHAAMSKSNELGDKFMFLFRGGI